MELITQYCSPDQLKSVKLDGRIANNLPNQFQNVQKFELSAMKRQLKPLSVKFSESLRYLHLNGIYLDPNFDWKKLTNLTELRLESIRGINVQSFIEFLHQQPNLEIFHHCRVFGASTQDVLGALAKYCGNRLRDYSGVMPENVDDNFLSGFKNLKKMHSNMLRQFS